MVRISRGSNILVCHQSAQLAHRHCCSALRFFASGIDFGSHGANNLHGIFILQVPLFPRSILGESSLTDTSPIVRHLASFPPTRGTVLEIPPAASSPDPSKPATNGPPVPAKTTTGAFSSGHLQAIADAWRPLKSGEARAGIMRSAVLAVHATKLNNYMTLSLVAV